MPADTNASCTEDQVERLQDLSATKSPGKAVSTAASTIIDRKRAHDAYVSLSAPVIKGDYIAVNAIWLAGSETLQALMPCHDCGSGSWLLRRHA